MSHDTHFVEEWLSVEEDDIVVSELPFDDPSVGEHVVRGHVFDISEINPGSLGCGEEDLPQGRRIEPHHA